MVVLMDVTAQGRDDAGRICTGPECGEEESSRIDPSLLESIPSSIPTSCIYRYQDFIATLLADGFYGNIYKVQHRETKEVMVLKMNKPDVERDTCTMLDEIKMMSHLSHENVIRFLGICVDENRVHLLCEFVNGGNLESLLLEHSVYLDWTTRLYLARDIAEGMRYLHKNGVIHRDLTSKNCLIKERNGWRYAIVADLGLATEIKEQSIVGSPYNMAPELLRGENYDEKAGTALLRVEPLVKLQRQQLPLTPQADVFSYGIILCEIIGRVPADPDELPRTNSFGLDVEKFQHMTGDCPRDFLQTALCCCQVEPSSRPTFVETGKHLEYILVGTEPFRPLLSEAMDSRPPRISTEENICQPENKLELEPEESRRGEEVEDYIATSPELLPPAIIVSTEASPSMVRSAEKRRQSWIAGRYKLFNTATDDLLKNTPSKLKSFFHRVLRVQTHFDPSKQKKVKDGPKQRSASQLKSFSVFDPQENGNVVTFVEKEGSYPCPPHSRGFLRRKSSGKIVTSESGSQEDSVDGNCSPRSLSSESALSLTSASTLDRPTSPNSLELTRSSPSARNLRESDTLVHNSNRPRRKSIPVCNDDKSAGPVPRRTKSHRECRVNSANHLTPEVPADDAGGIKNRKSPFWFFKRRGSKCKDPE